MIETKSYKEAQRELDRTNLLNEQFKSQCISSTAGSEWSLHQLAPYIGKVKSSIARFLIESFSQEGDTVLDPFCGAGTIPLEALTLGRHAIGNDLNKYAYVLTNAKLTAIAPIDEIVQNIENYDKIVQDRFSKVDITTVPEWVAAFFHPKTLQEIIVWMSLLQQDNSWFLLSCLLGILHHQRPGFLSFPSSHTVPYLRVNKFPLEQYSNLYEYRNVKERLIRKVYRALKRLPAINPTLNSVCYNEDATSLEFNEQVNAVITSPPYMRQLDYARDNRLRLWFLGVSDYKSLDTVISPKEADFVSVITNCLTLWHKVLKPNGKCVLFLGDNYSKKYKQTLPELIESIIIAKEIDFKSIFKLESVIPNSRRIRKGYRGNKVETILAFQKM